MWIPMLDKDTIDAAIPSVNILSDSRIHHFYDKNKIVGKTIANTIGWEGNIAWDIYLFYGSKAVWKKTPPPPNYWMHQLTKTWATKDKYRTCKDLKNELSVSMEKLIAS